MERNRTLTAVNRTRATAIIGAVALVMLVAAQASHALGTGLPWTRVQMRQHVALPGVVLSPGLYRFEAGDLGGGFVRVTSANGRITHFVGLTRRVNRPRSMPLDQTRMAFDEAIAGSPQPIRVWYPAHTRAGYEFIYR